jgi:hypothetical protein
LQEEERYTTVVSLLFLSFKPDNHCHLLNHRQPWGVYERVIEID